MTRGDAEPKEATLQAGATLVGDDTCVVVLLGVRMRRTTGAGDRVDAIDHRRMNLSEQRVEHALVISRLVKAGLFLDSLVDTSPTGRVAQRSAEAGFALQAFATGDLLIALFADRGTAEHRNRRYLRFTSVHADVREMLLTAAEQPQQRDRCQ